MKNSNENSFKTLKITDDVLAKALLGYPQVFSTCRDENECREFLEWIYAEFGNEQAYLEVNE